MEIHGLMAGLMGVAVPEEEVADAAILHGVQRAGLTGAAVAVSTELTEPSW